MNSEFDSSSIRRDDVCCFQKVKTITNKNMKHLKVFLLLLLVAPSASAQTDSTKVQNDSITWNKEIEGVTVKALRQYALQQVLP